MSDWSLARRIGFRFVFAYLVLYNLPLEPWTNVVPWVGRHVLHLGRPITIFPGGSGDTTYNYVQVLLFLIAAVLTTAAWSFLDRRRKNYERLEGALRIGIRYLLAFAMFTYGFYKVFKTQFPFPPTDWLLETYGDSSPMRLLWAFMGYSTPYTVFAGLGEVAGGLLLLSRRTTTLGALVVVAVMSNVVMLNMSYDVPVKLYSIHLLLMALLLAAPDARRLASFCFLNRPVPAVPTRTPFSIRWIERTRLGLKLAIIAMMLYGTISQSVDRRRRYGDAAPKPALYGLYEVEEFIASGQTKPPLLTDSARWRRLIFDRSHYVGILAMDGSDKWYQVADDAAAHTATLTAEEDKNFRVVLTYARPDADHLTVEGSFLGDALEVHLKRRDESSFLLVNRGFHWINEYPFNR